MKADDPPRRAMPTATFAGAPPGAFLKAGASANASPFIVGEDEFGYMLADILKENNVNNEGMRFDPGARTALAFVTLKKDGEREFMFYRNPSADMLLEESELDLDLIRKAKIFHYGSISLITEPCKSAHIAATKVAKDAGVLLSYDPNLRLPLWPSAESAREGILSIWDTADIIKISEEEIVFLTNGEDPYDDNVVRKLYHENLKLLLVTEGPDGCRYYTKEFSGRVKGIKVDPVDTTGAGDAFVAGVLSKIAADTSLLKDEKRLRDALRFANACGAITVTERGAIPALPTTEAISEEEIVFLTNGEDPYDDNVVRKLYHENLKLLLVTEGPDGCRYYTKEFSGRVKGIKVDPVDTTGAGDAFVAGVLSKIAADTSLLKDEKRLRDALRFANACGAITVTERGAIPALPTTEAVMNALLKTVA
uniref:fructokinase n=1 Tax=Tanacetum cinerariifolium TaxID=118510 RepID=A0A699IKT8_TANCI|nr:probable fructokinase-6, chloroplastic [Tanacetum cinerariifolium]